ncbi:MAG: DUF4147 domain-containing protein [Fuerstiella sp.]
MMNLREDAIAIWQAGVDAVRSEHLVAANVCCTPDNLTICGQDIPIRQLRRIEIIGAGKAGAGMSRGLLTALRPLRPAIEIGGWVNVPADCAEPLNGITLHPARPAGLNEPTQDGVRGTQEMLKRVAALGPSDLCLALISGGGSALMPAPVPGISLADKLAVTRLLARRGAPIEHLNIVRSQLSLVKGGGLLRHCTAGRLLTLIVSDVIGDPLEIIASGPTTDSTFTAKDALQILADYDSARSLVPTSVYRFLEGGGRRLQQTPCPVDNFVIGSNAIALAAAAAEAARRGYEVQNLGSENSGNATEHGNMMFERLCEQRDRNRTTPGRAVCLLAGGETTVRLADNTTPGQGGRNQEVVLSAISGRPDAQHWQHVALLSGGTDGEDGPTDAAGAVADAALVQNMVRRKLDPDSFLAVNNSYPFFRELDGLLITGPTHTNVMDVAVGLTGA